MYVRTSMEYGGRTNRGRLRYVRHRDGACSGTGLARRSRRNKNDTRIYLHLQRRGHDGQCSWAVRWSEAEDCLE